MSYSDSNPVGRLLQHRIKKVVPRYDKCLNSGREYVENISTFAVSVPINLIMPIKLHFVSIDGSRET